MGGRAASTLSDATPARLLFVSSAAVPLKSVCNGHVTSFIRDDVAIGCEIAACRCLRSRGGPRQLAAERWSTN